MVTREYLCRVCSHGFEIEQRITDPILEKCPKCLVCALNVQISDNTQFILKGGGWASDLYSPKKERLEDGK